jgi:hypothetical protein
MEFWDHIINTALLGTDKRTISISELPEAMAEVATQVQQNNAVDKEEQFLQIASLAFNYRQCGAMPLQKEGVTTTRADVEEKKYGSAVAMRTLNDILETDSNSLLQFWLQECVAKEQIVIPDLVPVLFNTAVQQKKLQNLIVACCGKRGEWLSRFNSDWNFSTAATDEELWQTGSPEQRKTVLQQLRQLNPAQAREWLQQSWPQEDANTKVELLPLLSVNISEEDIAFLESCSTEKSKKVKDEALKLLKQIPGSAIIQKYWQAAQQSVTIVHENSKKQVHIQLANIDDSIFKSGIQQLSDQKNVSDESFILYQLFSFIPPEWWEQYFNADPRTIIQLFKKDEAAEKLVPAFGMAAGRFKNITWGRILMEDVNTFYYDLALLLPGDEREQYLLRYFDHITEMAVKYLTEKVEGEWGLEITKAFLTHTAKSPHQYNKAFYSKHIHHMPVTVLPELEKCAPSEEHLKTYWNNNIGHITKLIQLKIKTIKSFNE